MEARVSLTVALALSSKPLADDTASETAVETVCDASVQSPAAFCDRVSAISPRPFPISVAMAVADSLSDEATSPADVVAS